MRLPDPAQLGTDPEPLGERFSLCCPADPPPRRARRPRGASGRGTHPHERAVPRAG